jgi:hypothetical protein
MSILIKGMEMPKSCLSCPLQGGTADCRLTQKTYNWGLPERPSDCPLVPVPPHGRCIDADELVRENYGQYGAIDALALEAIKAAPTIIPAEEERT